MDTFSRMNVDPLEGAEIMRTANISVDDLRDPRTFEKVKDIMAFFQGKTDKGFMISKLHTGKPGINPIDHLWGYSTLRTNYDKLSNQLEQIKDQISYYER